MRHDSLVHTLGALMWIMSHSCVTWLIHMCAMTHSYVWHDVLVHTLGALTWMCHVTHEWVMSHTYTWVMSPIWMSHVTHIWVSHVTHMYESCDPQYAWVMSHTYERVKPHMNESYTYEWVMSKSHDTPCIMTHSQKSPIISGSFAENMSESSHTHMGHVTNVNESWYRVAKTHRMS